jgi:2-polyprenyl-3-methyl-5-hydroxy-6-metoxy-1,4-benzoquinol methylase
MGRRGHQVIGIDVAARFLDEARRTAEKSGVSVEFRNQRASELKERDAFAFAFAYWHTIGFMT